MNLVDCLSQFGSGYWIQSFWSVFKQRELQKSAILGYFENFSCQFQYYVLKDRPETGQDYPTLRQNDSILFIKYFFVQLGIFCFVFWRDTCAVSDV